MDDKDGDKRARFFEDKKRERERQLKERKKRLDGSDSEGDEGGVKEGNRLKWELTIPSHFSARQHAQLPPKQKEHLKQNTYQANLTK